jgi:hypothetical protein
VIKLGGRMWPPGHIPEHNGPKVGPKVRTNIEHEISLGPSMLGLGTL